LEKIRLRCVFAVVMEMLKSAAASLMVAPVLRRFDHANLRRRETMDLR
jgi:hypothetical protein